MNTSQVYMSLETRSMGSLSKKQIKQVGNAKIQLPSNLNTNISSSSPISIRVCFFFSFRIISFFLCSQ